MAGRPAKYPFADLEVGQCFIIPSTEVTRGTAGALCSQWSKRLDRRFSCHAVAAGWQIERIADEPPTYAIGRAPLRRTHQERMAAVAAVVAKLTAE